jgi:hypothetical protein
MMHSKRGRLLVAFLIAAVSLIACSNGTEPRAVPQGEALVPDSKAQLTLVVDGGQFSRKRPALSHTEPSMTVKMAIQKVGDIKFELKEYPGMGHIVERIGNVGNNDHEGRYWQFCIDGRFSDRGIDEVQVQANQEILWTYSAYGEAPCKKIGEE